MKLYPLIYTNEAARTADESVSMGIAAMGVKLGVDTPARIVLFSRRRAAQAIEKKDDDQNKESNFAIRAMALGKRAIVGVVSYSPVPGVDDLYQVSSSAGVNKFGPLAYQIAMRGIRGSESQPGWLKSDTSLTEGKKQSSANVWNQMYRMPEIYERKWLGDFTGNVVRSAGENMVRTAMIATDSGHMLFRNYPSNKKTTEQDVLKFLADNNEKMENFGNLYAYRTKSPDAKIQGMFDQGEEFLTEMENKGHDYEEIRKLMHEGAVGFFERRYKSE